MTFWETAQWWNWKPESAAQLGFGGRVSVVIINLLVFVFALTAALITR